MASAGDVNGDAFSDVILGAPYFTNGQSAEGRAFAYYGRSGVAAIEPGIGVPVTTLRLEAISPNPFAPRTAITYAVGEAGRVVLRVYDAGGRPVTALVDGATAGGRYVETWDGRNDHGASVAAGITLPGLPPGARSRLASWCSRGEGPGIGAF